MLNNLLVGAVVEGVTMPDFPTFDLSTAVNWMITGVTSFYTANAPVLITGAIVMAALPMAIKKITKFTKSGMQG